MYYFNHFEGPPFQKIVIIHTLFFNHYYIMIFGQIHQFKEFCVLVGPKKLRLIEFCKAK